MNHYAATLIITHHEYSSKAALVYASETLLDVNSSDTKIKVMQSFQQKNPSFEFDHYAVEGDELSRLLDDRPADFDWQALELKFIDHGLWINVDEIKCITETEFSFLSSYATEIIN